MRRTKILFGTALVIVGLPLVALLVTVVSIFAFDRADGTIVSSGETRHYLLHVPDSYNRTAAIPLVISLHAGATWPAHQKNLSRWNRLADEHGFIVVYPSGSPQLFNLAKIWQTTPEGVESDVQFISALIDRLEAEYNIDPAKIYVNGMSMGGGMAFVLSCTLSDRIAAIGMVAAAHPLPSSLCTDPQPMPMMTFHGTADPIVPYAGGLLGDPFNPVKPEYPPVRDWVASWAQRNRCAAVPIESTIASDVVRTEYPDCAEGAPVVLYSILGGGHSWPGGKPPPEWRVGVTSGSIDATGEMWTFFREHPLRR